MISTPMAGSSSPKLKSSRSTTFTFGVVMSTRLLSRLETAVAEDPRLMFMTSPMASNCMGLNTI